jgi:hypothetical protein
LARRIKTIVHDLLLCTCAENSKTSVKQENKIRKENEARKVNEKGTPT